MASHHIRLNRALLLAALCLSVPALGASCRLGAGECLERDDCSSDELCSMSSSSSSCGMCSEPASLCGKDADCGGTLICEPASCPCNPSHRSCTSGCTSDGDCDAGGICDAATHRCAPRSCSDDDDCGDDYCEGGSCVEAGSCVSNATAS